MSSADVPSLRAKPIGSKPAWLGAETVATGLPSQPSLPLLRPSTVRLRTAEARARKQRLREYGRLEDVEGRLLTSPRIVDADWVRQLIIDYAEAAIDAIADRHRHHRDRQFRWLGVRPDEVVDWPLAYQRTYMTVRDARRRRARFSSLCWQLDWEYNFALEIAVVKAFDEGALVAMFDEDGVAEFRRAGAALGLRPEMDKIPWVTPKHYLRLCRQWEERTPSRDEVRACLAAAVREHMRWLAQIRTS
jgi:hypothetical protein